MNADIVERLRMALMRPGPGSSDFDLNPDAVPPRGRRLRPAAVLVPISLAPMSPAAGAPTLILTRRSSALKHHPGQVAFPGGKIDATDAGPEAAALREAREEIGLPPELVKILGRLPDHETVTGFRVTPVVAVIRAPFDPLPEPGEVDEVFSVPLSHVLNPDSYSVQSRRWRGRRRYYFTAPWGPYYIWGATARMLRGLAARMES